MKNQKRKSSWQWYSVKILFESTIFGEPNQEKVDENYTNKFKLYEERIVIVRAQSFDHAFKVAESKVKENEMEYYNPYDQLVKCKFVDSLNCYHLFDEEIKSGAEVYSRLFQVPVEAETERVIDTYYPETLPNEKEETPFYSFLISG